MLQMKKIHKGISYAVLAFFIITSAILYVVVPNSIANFAYINWIALAALVVFLVSPLGSSKLQLNQPLTTNTEKEKKSTPPALIKKPLKSMLSHILLLQTSVLLILYGAAQIGTRMLPLTKTTPNVFVNTLSHTLIQQGLFPWGLISLFAIAFGIIAYQRNQDCYFNDITLIPFKNLHPYYGIIVDNIGRNMTYIALAIASVTATISLAYLLVGPSNIKSITGLQVGSMGAVLLMCFLTFKRGTHPTLAMIQNEKPNVGIFITVILWAALFALAGFVIHHVAQGKNTALAPSILTSIFKHGFILHWHLFVTGTLFCFTPLISLYVARFSYGYTIRAMICSSLLLPIVLAILFGFNQHFHFITHLSLNTRIAEGAPIIGLVLLLYLVCRKKTLAMTNILFLAKPGGIKQRSTANFIDRWKKFSGVLFYFMIPASIYVVSLFLILEIIMFVILFVLVIVRLVALFRNPKAQSIYTQVVLK